MKRVFGLVCVGSLAVALTGCGGGGSADITVGSSGSHLIAWPGSSSDVHVIDGLGHVFAFYADNGCLYNAQTGQENTAFCLIPGSNVVAYGPFRGQIENVIASNGTCQAAIVDQISGTFADIELDAYGREVVRSTSLPPAYCGR